LGGWENGINTLIADPLKSERLNFNDLISIGSLVSLAGYILSGPVAFIIVRALKPQPPWQSSSVFAENYHVVQDLPYYCGFLLIGGMLMVFAGHYLNCSKEKDTLNKFYLLVAFGWVTVFVTLVSFNYICQTTYVRNLALHYRPEYDIAIATFSMANPLSFCWANEMWGYAFLGVSTWLAAGYYKNKNNIIRTLMIANGIVSLAGALWTIIDINWIMTIAGVVSYLAWNVLMIVMMTLIYRHSGKESQVQLY
jgi:hypothetical protein